MPDQEAPSSIRVQRARKLASLGKSVQLGGDFLDIDELIEYSVSLEEWLRLVAGDFDIGEKNNERIVKILAAHQAKSIELCNGQLRRDDESCGVFGKNFTMGLKVQLRNPFCNYEMVGSSMPALIQVERFYFPLQREQNGAEYGLDEQLIQERINFEQKQDEIHENHVPRFKISDVYLAGLNVELGDKWLWGPEDNKSGSQWLFSSGMSTPNKLSISISNAIVKPSTQITRKACPGDVLWSISSNIQGEAAT